MLTLCYFFSGRPGRSAPQYGNSTTSINGTAIPRNESDINISRIYFNSTIETDNNKTTRMIHIVPMNNSTVFKLLTPVL